MKHTAINALMRKSAILLLMFSGTLSVSAQYYMNVFQKDGKKIQYLISDLDSISITEKPAPSGNYEYVDLGLSVNWATFNVGATKPEEYGDYYAWGETETKTDYSWKTYKWCTGSFVCDTITKYNTSSRYVVVDNKITLDPEDDVAHVKWGGNWRMPTKEEQFDLYYKCTWEWYGSGNTEFNGVAGYKVTSNIEGYTDRSLFLPAPGYRDLAGLNYDGSGGGYWSSSLYTDGPYSACLIGFGSSGVQADQTVRYLGFPVRPVCPPEECHPSINVSLLVDNKTLLVGNKYKVPVIVKLNDEIYENPPVVWISDNPSVAQVSENGIVTALSAGTAHIIGSIQSLSAQLTVTVIEESDVEPEYVDLGLSVKWATFNVGAIKPEEYGDYYAWGETEPYYVAGYAREDPQSHWKEGKTEGYGWYSYKWCNGSYSSLTKYGIVSEWGVVDNMIILEKEDDVAHVKWGGSWRMPTLSEWNELLRNCTYDWYEEGNSEFGGVAGVKITSNKFGYTDRFIFLPAAGLRYDMSLDGVGNGGLYWSSSLDTEGTDCAWDIFFNSYGRSSSYDHRCNGLTVRPVCPSEEWLSCVIINFAKDNKTLSVGSNEILIVDVKHNDKVWDNPLIIWSSDNPSVAVVDQNGWIAAKSVGTAHITASIESLSAQCTITVIEEQVSEPEYVDLGLSVNWATFNVGATKPEDYGEYYAWGETEAKSTYYESTYKWFRRGSDLSDLTITKYNFISGCGTVDNKTILEPEDDVAHVKWGGSWRMPTKDELDELRNNCIWTWGTMNGVNGYFITSNKSGYTDRSIFLPAAGDRRESDLNCVGFIGNYWSSSLSTGGPHGAQCFSFAAANGNVSSSGRNYGLSVRPVCPSEEWFSSISINIVEDNKTLLVNGSAMLNYTVKHNGEVYNSSSIIWSSDNPSVAVVDESGVVTAISAGTANITASIRSLSAQCTVTVIDDESEIEHEYVDLGLSVKWATFNVGATNPEDFGAYYAWGETDAKSTYTWFTYKWGQYNSITKYNNNSSGETVNNKIILEPEDDVAYVKWGGSWRMPTKAELDELMDNCTWIWTTVNSVNGYLITSNKSGYTDRSIFLPAAGCRNDTDLNDADDVGSYWSSRLNLDYPNSSYYLNFDSIYVDCSSNNRNNGFSVRPVCPSEEWFSSISINIVEDNKTLLVNGSAMLNYTVKHNGEVHKSSPIIWSSDNPSVAVVDESGVVTAISAGTANITASIRSLSAQCTVTVIDDESEIEHEYVDLGLSVKWATFNVGATNPEDFGAYYAWGETETKSVYTWESYKFRTSGYTGDYVKISKYNTNSNYGPVDNDTILDAIDDVAHVKWGGSWRMPTKAEQDELRNNCTWKWTTLNGVQGYLVTSNVPDYTGRSIFLPAAGHRYNTDLYYVGSEGYYWASLLGPEDYASGACVIYLYSYYLGMSVHDRSLGYSVRPVCPK